MASLQQEPTGQFHIVIFYAGKRFKRSLKTKKETVAITRQEEIEETLDLVKRGRLMVPEGTDIIDFAMANGKVETITPSYASAPTDSRQLTTNPTADSIEDLTLGSLLSQFFNSIPEGTLEECTLSQMGTHNRHLLRLMGANLNLNTITSKHLQDYINARAKEPTQMIRDKSVSKEQQERVAVSSATIQKEIVTLGSAWRWAESTGLLSTKLPKRGLRWPKTDEKPPFQTWEEIERQIHQDLLTSSEADQLWDCLYLRLLEIEDLLEYVRNNARYPYVYPLFAMAAYTGARRSELIRSRRCDFDFGSNTMTIRERKRVRGKRSTRRVPICHSLRVILEAWFAQHSGGPWTFVSTNRDGKVQQITRDQIQNQFNQTLKNSRWETVKGWHCLRHSFISNLASAGIDQRIIDDFVGHTTEEMRQRYRHLLPDVKQAALDRVFPTQCTGTLTSTRESQSGEPRR